MSVSQSTHKVDLLIVGGGVAGTVAADKMRQVITATNGDPCARVYEFRAYASQELKELD